MPALDVAGNFGKVTVLNPYDASATSIVLQTGQGARLPAIGSSGGFNMVWWNSAAFSDPSDDPNREIVRVTNIATDTLTVTRNQEGTGASTKNTAGGVYKMALIWSSKIVNTDLYNCFSPDAFFGRMPNPTFPKAYVNNTANGNNDVYTVPTGRSAIVFSLSIANFGANNPNCYMQVKSGGTYYQVGTAAAAGASPTNNTIQNTVVPFLLLAGEILSLHADATGASAWFSVIEFDSATTNLTRGFITSLSNGNNTLYTVPAGKTARVLPRFGFNSATTLLSGIVIVLNASGGALNYIFYAVPSGGSTGATNEFSTTTGVGNLAFASGLHNGNLSAGDFFVVNTSGGTATQTAWVVMIEN